MAEESLTAKSQSNSYFTFKTVASGRDPFNETRIFALRYQVYCLECGFLAHENYPHKLEQDEYDAFSTHVAAYSQNDIMVGSLRLVTPPEGMPFPFQVHCKNLFADKTYPPNRKCTEISRLVISKLYRRRAGDTLYGVPAQLMADPADPNAPHQNSYDRRKARREGSERRRLQPEILLGILRQVYRHCKLNGIEYWFMALEKPLARLLSRLFFFSLEPIGEQVDYYGPVTPYILSMAHFDYSLSRGDPILFSWFMLALDE